MTNAARGIGITDKIPMAELPTFIVGNHIRIIKGRETHSFYIGPFVQKYLDSKACAGCGLTIQYAQIMRIEKNSKAKLYFFGERDGVPIQFTKDHCIPLARGGPNVKENIQVMCSDCNTFKSDSLSMNPIMWVLKKKIEFESVMARYNQLFNSSAIDHETFLRRIQHVTISYDNMRRRAKQLFNLSV